jgi:hypothetical protein
MQIKMRMPMKLKMSSYTAGSDFALAPGDVTDRFPDAEALRLIEKGYATLVEAEPERTVKVQPAAETRAPRSKRR